MKIFLDTSSLFKLYHREADTEALELLLSTKNVTDIFLSEITKVKFVSTSWKKVPTTEIAATEAQVTLNLFESDVIKYTFIATDSIIIEHARVLTSK